MSARKIMLATLLAIAAIAPVGAHAAAAPTPPWVAGPDLTDGSDVPVTDDFDPMAVADNPTANSTGYTCDMVPIMRYTPSSYTPFGEGGNIYYHAHMSCNFTARAIDVYAILQRKQGNGSWQDVSGPNRATCMDCAAPQKPADGETNVWVINGEAQSQWRVRGIFEVRFPSNIKARRFSRSCAAPDGQFVGCVRYSSIQNGP